MKIKEKQAISLIVLVITIIILSILAATVIISISNTNVINETSKTVFKSDMSTYKETYETYLVTKKLENTSFDRKSLNLTYKDDEFSDIFGNVPDKYKEGLKVVGGELIYESTDETENEVLGQIGMKLEYISKDKSYVGYFADTNGDGTVDGVIFADLCFGGSVSWGNETATISTIDKNVAKDYYVSEESCTALVTSGYASHPVLTAYGDGEDRFYVMALDEVNNGTKYTLYAGVYEVDSFGLAGYESLTSTSRSFGSGYLNTKALLEGWLAEKYGPKQDDLWSYIQSYVDNGWFVPSVEEWTAFMANLDLDWQGAATSTFFDHTAIIAVRDTTYSEPMWAENGLDSAWSVRLAITF